ncbi:MAG: hypothetical protein ACJ8CB_07045, partial [Ktedonobacteraceae bacterium]
MYTSFRGGQKEEEGPHDAKDVQVFEKISLPPSDWFNRLKATPGVSKTGFLDPKDGVCRAVVYGTPPPGAYKYRFFNPKRGYERALGVFAFSDAPFPSGF